MSTLAAPVLRTAVSAMGTRFEFVVADTRAFQPLVEDAVREIERLHDTLTRFAPDSLTSFIMRTAFERPVRLDRATFQLLEQSVDVYRRSDGAFDITLGNGDAIVLDAQSCAVSFTRQHVPLDFGAIAKGFALDRAAAILRAGGVTSALLHGGTSSVLAIGAPPDRESWRVSLARSHALPFVELRDSALAVSRPFSQVYDGAAHIIDARAGASVRVRRFAVVTGPSACVADAWSTALAVTGARPHRMPADYTSTIEPDHE